MSPLNKLFTLLFLLCALPAGAQTITTATVDGGGGSYTSQAIIGGNPAIAYFNSATGDLKFARNSQTDGLGYWTTYTVDSAGVTGLYPSLTMVAGNPAISYYDQTNGDLRFARNSAADGSGTWAISTVDSTGDTGLYSSLGVASGRPVISYYDKTSSNLRFARNSAADGSGAWVTATVGFASSLSSQSISLAIVSGQPAIAYTDSYVVFARNSAADGSGTWTSSRVSTNKGYSQLSLTVINGYPSIAAYDGYILQFARASSTDGLTAPWTFNALENTKGIGNDPSLTAIYGTPAISYGGIAGVKLARNSVADGSGVWSFTTVDGSTALQFSSLSVVNGNPAISYSAGNGNPSVLKHAILRYFQEIAVEQPAGADLASGASRSLSAPVGGSSNLTFTVRNTGGADLTGLVLSKDGANASEFTLDPSAPAMTLVPGGTTSFTVRFQPASFGGKTAALHLASNDADENPFNVNLTGTVLTPDIAVEQPTGTSLTSGKGSVGFGTLAQGTAKSLTFTVRNAGAADLTGLSVTVDGANGPDFTVTAGPGLPTLPPQASTTFTLQFRPPGSGSRTATVHLASNDPDENPFDVTVTGLSLSFSQDTDGDGLSDAAEFQLAALGFDWQKAQPDLVNALYANASGAGLYTASQVQALNVGTPLLARNPSTGQFTLTLGVRKSTDLIHFTDLPMSAPQTTVNAQGKIEFRFTSTDGAGFYLIEAN